MLAFSLYSLLWKGVCVCVCMCVRGTQENEKYYELPSFCLCPLRRSCAPCIYFFLHCATKYISQCSCYVVHRALCISLIKCVSFLFKSILKLYVGFLRNSRFSQCGRGGRGWKTLKMLSSIRKMRIQNIFSQNNTNNIV